MDLKSMTLQEMQEYMDSIMQRICCVLQCMFRLRF